MPVHPTAILEGSISLPDEDSVEIGPYAVLRGKISIGSGTVIGPHACVEGEVEMGCHNRIGHGAVVGGLPQDLSFDPDTPSAVHMGDNNTLREHVTIHRGSSEGAATHLGDGNFLMAGSHLGHDVVLGDRNILANLVLVAGHVTFGNDAFVGGAALFHQFIRIGDRVMIQGKAGFSLDLPPYVLGHGVNEVLSLNVVGLRRANVPAPRRVALKKAWALVYRDKLPLKEIQKQALEGDWQDEAAAFLQFFLQSTKKGFCR